MLPQLTFGRACMRKKPTDKYKVCDVDYKAVEKSIFIEQIQMFGDLWDKFEDYRGWTWIQPFQKVKEDEAI